MVARMGGNTPSWLLLTAIGARKSRFGAVFQYIGYTWAAFRITADRFGMEISRFWASFASDWCHT